MQLGVLPYWTETLCNSDWWDGIFLKYKRLYDDETIKGVHEVFCALKRLFKSENDSVVFIKIIAILKKIPIADEVLIKDAAINLSTTIMK